MSRFAQDFRRLVNDTHHSRLASLKAGITRGFMLGTAVGYLIETYHPLSVPWILTGTLALVGGIVTGYYEREAVILRHLTQHADQYDPRLLLLLRDGIKPNLSSAEEDSIARFVVSPQATAYERQLFQSISRELNDKIERLSLVPVPPTGMAHINAYRS